MFKAFAYRLYPTASQKRTLGETLETCRHFYNKCLEERKFAHEQSGKTIGFVEQCRQVKVAKANNPYAANVHSHILQTVVKDLQKAFDAFFRRVKAGEKPGYPRFKPRQRFRSFGLKEYGNGFRVDGRRLKISGIGRIPVRWHRPLEGTVKSVRVQCRAGKWYAIFACEVAAQPLPDNANEVGLDVGLNSLVTLSTGEQVENPRWYRKTQQKLRRLHRKVHRRKKGGANRRKAVLTLAKFQECVSNQRKDYLNKLAHGLIVRFGRIALEDLSIRRMVRGRFAKSILDAGWGYFRQRLLCKAENAGRKIALVEPAHTSQDCCQCGHRQKLSLKDRWYTCLQCGNSRNRDENAAANILQAGRACWASNSSVEGLAQEAAGL